MTAYNAHAGVISILIDTKTEKALSEIKKWNNKILIVNCNGNPNIIIIMHYSPCEGSLHSDEYNKHISIATSTIPNITFNS